MDKNLGEEGKKQSPINLSGSFKEAAADQENLTFDYQDLPKEKNAIIERDQMTGKIFVRASYGSVNYYGKVYDNFGFYIHHPSEHTFGEGG